MLAVIAAVLFAVGFVLRLAGASLGKMDGIAFVLAGLFFLALHLVWPLTPWHRAP